MAAILRWTFGGALIVFSAWVCVANASVLWIWYVQKRRPPSWIPLVGGISGAAGLWLLPIAALHRWWWLPLVLDWGSVPGIGYSMVYHAAFRRSRAKEK
jgi:hypothetical protein